MYEKQKVRPAVSATAELLVSVSIRTETRRNLPITAAVQNSSLALVCGIRFTPQRLDYKLNQLFQQ